MQVRWVVAFLAFVGFIFNYMLRVNINLTIVSMVNYTQQNDDADVVNECGKVSGNSSSDSDSNSKSDQGEFVWDSVVQSQIVGSFYYGYILTQLPGGRMAEVIGAKRVLGISMAGVAICNLLLPLSTQIVGIEDFPWPVIVLRALMGVCEGATFPSISAMMAKWAPQAERSRMSTFIYAGSQAGTIIAFPLAGVIADSLGWRWVFYIQGASCLIWVAIWWMYVSDTPATHKYITAQEVEYIQGSRPKFAKAPAVPWKDLLTSWPFLAIFIANFGNNWGFHLLLTELPIYMKTILKRDINSNALLSSLPYACMWAFSLLVSYLADKAVSKKTLKTGIVRRIATFIAHGGPALCLVGICFTGCQETLTIALLTLAITMQGALYSGFFTNPLDIAPNYSGTILGITNAFGTIPGWLAPLIAGAFTREKVTI